MHKLTIVFGPTGTTWPLLFRTKETADAAWTAAISTSDEHFSITDDFQQKITIRLDAICGIMIEDLEVSKLAHVEHQLYVWRVGAAAQQQAVGDPILRTAAQRQGPAVITPQGVNGFGPRGF